MDKLYSNNNQLKQITHNYDDDENLAVGFRGSNVKEHKRNAFDVFEPKHIHNVRFNKKYFSSHHKNNSHFNAYNDYLKNLKEFENK